MTAAVIPSSRRVSAGIAPDPGATSRLPAWWGAEDWLEELTAALEERPELLTGHHVSRDAVLATARGMAAYADHRTGRDCRPTNERLVQALRCSLSTVQRARRVLKGLGMVVELVGGRSIMTRGERLEAWRRGSSHRQIAAVFALCSRSRRAPRRRATSGRYPLAFHSAPTPAVERDTPPGAGESKRVSPGSRTHPRRRADNEDRRFAPSSCRSGHHGDVRRLAEDTRRRLGWLHGTSWRRIAPTLARFARAGWSVRDVDLAVRDALNARGWRLPSELRQPAAYLAGLLRAADEADRPTAAEDFRRELERRENAYRLQLATGARCAHGMPAGDVRSPLRGLVACPQCRAENRAP